MNSQLTTAAIVQMYNNMPRPMRPTPFPITRLDERMGIFRRFRAICHKYNLGTLNTLALCLFLILPVDRLEHYVGIASDYNVAVAVHGWFCTTARTGLKVCLAKLQTPAITNARVPSAAAVLTSSPLAQRPMNISPTSEPARTTRKRKARDPSWDGPSTRTRLRTRAAESAARLPLPARATREAREANRPALITTPLRHAPWPTSSPSTPPSLVTAVPSGSPFAPPSPTLSFIQRNHTAVAAARARDHGRCILTDHALVQAAHIYPLSATKLAYHAASAASAASGASMRLTTRHEAVGTLLGLWGNKLRATWRNACNNIAVSETAQNILCLDHYMHALWGRTYFGLEPLAQREAAGPDGAHAEIDICFHWLFRGSRQPRDPVDDPDDDTIAAVCGRPYDPPPAPMAHRCSGVPLETGHVFTVRASSPSELPSFTLLEVQWHLTRLAAMSGAADADDADDEDDSDDDISRAASEEVMWPGEEDDDMGSVLYDTDVVPLDLNAADPADRACLAHTPYILGPTRYPDEAPPSVK